MAVKLLEPGIYEGKVKSWDIVMVGEKGTPALEIECRLYHRIVEEGDDEVKRPIFDSTEGDDDNQPTHEAVVRRVQIWMNKSDNIKRSLSTLRKCFNFRGQPKDLNPASPKSADFYGRTVRVRIKHEEYNGQPQERIEPIRSRDSIPEDEKKAIMDAIQAQFEEAAKAEAEAEDALKSLGLA